MIPNTSRARLVLQFLFAFSCVFAGLALPSPGVGHLFTRAHAALGNALVEGHVFDGGVSLRFTTSEAALTEHPWQLTLEARDPGRPEPVFVAIDLRTLLFLPFAAFIALSVAAPLGSARRNAQVLGIGLLILEPMLLVLTALPLLSFLGGTGPVQAFRLSPVAYLTFQTLYRALVAPPGMMYALPLLLWWVLVARSGAKRVPAVPRATPS